MYKKMIPELSNFTFFITDYTTVRRKFCLHLLAQLIVSLCPGPSGNGIWRALRSLPSKRLSHESNFPESSHDYNLQDYIFKIQDDVIKWKHFSHYWPFVWGIHRFPVNSQHKGQWRGALMFSFICVWVDGWVNNHKAGDLRCYPAHYDVTIMFLLHLLGANESISAFHDIL